MHLAIIGALYLDGGLDSAEAFFRVLLHGQTDSKSDDAKSMLQTVLRRFQFSPNYRQDLQYHH
jgi:dsRNA-specific ribonuclease